MRARPAVSIADYARALTLAQLEREIRAARNASAGDDYVSELERIAEEKRASAAGAATPSKPESA